MLFTVIYPDAYPEFASYVTSSSVITINVGFLADDINSDNTYADYGWTLIDAFGKLVSSGKVSVKLATFDSSVQLSNLLPNAFYLFSIFNELSGYVGNCVITTGNIIGTIDETDIFPLSTKVSVSSLLKVNKSDSGQSVSFRDDISFDDIGTKLSNGSFIGRSLVTVNNQMYAFVPSKLLTLNRTIPDSIDYVPFTGMASVKVPVIQKAKISKVGYRMWSIDPPSLIKVDTDVGSTEYKVPTSLVSLSDVGLYGAKEVIIEQVI